MRFAVRVPALHTTPQTRSRMHMLARSSPSRQGFRPRSSQSVGMAPRTTSCTVAAARRRARLEAATQRAVAACPATSGAAREQRQAGGRWWKACALAGATPPSKSSCKLMIAHLSALSADHEEIVEVPSSSRRTEGLPPGHRGDQGEQPLHPRGGGGTPSPLVGWAGGRWPVGAQTRTSQSTGCLCSARRANRATNTEAAGGSVRGGSGPRTSAAYADGQAPTGLQQQQPLAAICPRKAHRACNG